MEHETINLTPMYLTSRELVNRSMIVWDDGDRVAKEALVLFYEPLLKYPVITLIHDDGDDKYCLMMYKNMCEIPPTWRDLSNWVARTLGGWRCCNKNIKPKEIVAEDLDMPIQFEIEIEYLDGTIVKNPTREDLKKTANC